MTAAIHNSLASKSETTALKKIASSLARLKGVRKAVFFGSRLRGDFKGTSDMDILVVISAISLKDKIIHILHDIELKYDVPLSPVVFTNREYEANKRLGSSFIENIEKEGLILYDSERKRQG